jgi:hypothetical protein
LPLEIVATPAAFQNTNAKTTNIALPVEQEKIMTELHFVEPIKNSRAIAYDAKITG